MVTILFASDVFSAQAVMRAAHRHTASCAVEIESQPEGMRVVLTPRSEGIDEALLGAQLRNDALDEQLRAHVHEQTSALHVALVEAALRGARPARGPSS